MCPVSRDMYTTASSRRKKKNVPYLGDVVVMEGGAHFINQEKPEEINAHIYDFIKKF